MAKNKEGEFEKYLDSLEEIVKELESGELSLEKSIEKFEKGAELYKNCKKILSQSEKKITVLTEKLK
jgi:exodeoxyribonuclease VII small subunit